MNESNYLLKNIYLFERERVSEQEWGEGKRERESSRLPAYPEPDARAQSHNPEIMT